MRRFDTTASGPARSGPGTDRPGTDGLPGTGRDGTAQVTLAGVRDWVGLCRRCANSPPQGETPLAPAPARPLPAVVIPLKARRAQ